MGCPHKEVMECTAEKHEGGGGTADDEETLSCSRTGLLQTPWEQLAADREVSTATVYSLLKKTKTPIIVDSGVCSTNNI